MSSTAPNRMIGYNRITTYCPPDEESFIEIGVNVLSKKSCKISFQSDEFCVEIPQKKTWIDRVINFLCEFGYK